MLFLRTSGAPSVPGLGRAICIVLASPLWIRGAAPRVKRLRGAKAQLTRASGPRPSRVPTGTRAEPQIGPSCDDLRPQGRRVPAKHTSRQSVLYPVIIDRRWKASSRSKRARLRRPRRPPPSRSAEAIASSSFNPPSASTSDRPPLISYSKLSTTLE